MIAVAPIRGPFRSSLERALDEYVGRVVPGGTLESVRALHVDASDDGETTKGMGYGQPLRVDVRDREGRRHRFVLHTATANEFGHERRADRAAAMILAFDTFGSVAAQAPAVDVGVVTHAGGLRSIRDGGEFFLLTRWVEGTPYVDDLRALAQRGEATGADVERVEQLAAYLARLHVPRPGPGYVRAIRDLVGHGEGIFGIVDGYPDWVDDACAERLRRIEAAVISWRWELKGRTGRLVRTHGDFHPFNVLFDGEGRLSVLDASRGGEGEAADDVVAMAINFVFFGLQNPEAWPAGFRRLWRRFWRSYLAQRDDPELLEVVAPFLAWRALVLASPTWYPHIAPATRESLWRLAEGALAMPRFDPDRVEDFFE